MDLSSNNCLTMNTCKEDEIKTKASSWRESPEWLQQQGGLTDEGEPKGQCWPSLSSHGGCPFLNWSLNVCFGFNCVRPAAIGAQHELPVLCSIQIYPNVVQGFLYCVHCYLKDLLTRTSQQQIPNLITFKQHEQVICVRNKGIYI